MKIKEFLLKKYPKNIYRECPVPKTYWEDIQEYSDQQNAELIQAGDQLKRDFAACMKMKEMLIKEIEIHNSHEHR